MNINEVAAKLNDLRENRMSALLMTGQLRNDLGFEGYGEAIRRGWIVADSDSGMAQITQNMTCLVEMRKLAEEFKKDSDSCTMCHKKSGECKCEKCPDCEKSMCTCESVSENQEELEWARIEPVLRQQWKSHPQVRAAFPNASDAELSELWNERLADVRRQWQSYKAAHPPQAAPAHAAVSAAHHESIISEACGFNAHGYAVRHAQRPLNETATLGLGNPQNPAPRDTMATPNMHSTQQPTSAPQPSPERKGSVDVGTSVKIVQDGKEYVGKIAQVKPDGKMSVSFAGNQPPAKRDYDKTEVTPV